ncbi:MAG: dTDP-4-dehydrorhamnose 3,5-epimerase [Bacteroidota bacterium]
MDFIETNLKGAYLIELSLHKDERGGFARTFCKNEFKKIGHTKEFVQFNHSLNNKKGTLRGMHYQEIPHSEIKLIRCIKGAIYDVIIDIRQSSPTFLQWFGVELSATNMKMVYVPEGFAHGFQTMENNSELLYHHTNFYTPSSEKGIRFDDEMINIKWPGDLNCISEKDKNYPLLSINFKGINI